MKLLEKNKKHLSFIEIVIAFVIIGIAIIPLFDILGQAGRSTTFLKDDIIALFIAKRIAEIIKHQATIDFDNLIKDPLNTPLNIVEKDTQSVYFYNSKKFSSWFTDAAYQMKSDNPDMFYQFDKYSFTIAVENDPDIFAKKPIKPGVVMMKKVTVTVTYKVKKKEKDKQTELCFLVSR